MRRPGARGWVGWTALALSLLAAAGLIVVGLMVQYQDKQSTEDRANIAALSEALRKEQAARIDDGELPVTPPVEDIVSETPTLVRGEDGEDGAKGDRGEPGEDGKDGATAPCTTAPGSCQGARGETGERGPVGPADPGGATGAPGPAGPVGPPGETVVGPQGPAGVDGANGQPGAAGTNGADGAPGPQGPAAPTPGRVLLPATLGRQQECDLIWTAARLEAVNCVFV